VRGLNRKARRDSARPMVNSINPDVVCLQETKKEAISGRMVISMLGSDFDQFVVLPADGTRGGILLAWRGGVCHALSSRIDNFSVSVHFESEEGPSWWFTGVYGPQQDDQKIMFLQELHNIRQDCQGPWAIGGDFNLIYPAEDKNNANVNRAMMGWFRHFLDDMELNEIPLLGRKFTWSNDRVTPTLVRLDRVFMAADREQVIPDCVLQSAASMISDHCPLILELMENIQGK